MQEIEVIGKRVNLNTKNIKRNILTLQETQISLESVIVITYC